ncbi:MAG: ZIP family metal transporter [Thermoleophilia bacterium]|nr:ZIP family metal transporter [Thermoleophilia bacterium]
MAAFFDIQSVVVVFLVALGTALATGLGALPFLFVRNMSVRSIALASGLAAGFMIGASIGLGFEGATHSVYQMVGGLGIGYFGISLSMRLIDRWNVGPVTGNSIAPVDTSGLTISEEIAAVRRSASMFSAGMRIVLIMTIHSFSEGVGIGVGWGGGKSFGVLVAIAIAVHNIPEGLAISVALVARGASVGRAAWMSIVSSLPQPLMAVPAFIFVESFSSLLPWGLGFAAGAMLWMTFSDLLPDAVAGAGVRLTAAAACISAVIMVIFQVKLLPS